MSWKLKGHFIHNNLDSPVVPNPSPTRDPSQRPLLSQVMTSHLRSPPWVITVCITSKEAFLPSPTLTMNIPITISVQIHNFIILT